MNDTDVYRLMTKLEEVIVLLERLCRETERLVHETRGRGV